ncbi:hypothetical protein MKW94_001575 [Papaver nudicaule]|uniref:Uncharacterized protein n=1 Tax=Papaver nudicaule TaxID=74823 RepID=A0AA41VIL3_PAPNU|nr:hypothetical protein [Papaver nudicaule]
MLLLLVKRGDVISIDRMILFLLLSIKKQKPIYNRITDRVSTESFGKIRCARRSYFLQKSRCAAYNWSEKALGRKTTGSGRMQYLRNVPRRFKSGFREGTQAAPRKIGASAST